MSSRHQAHRRRAYGRRQHEMRERRARQETWDGFEFDVVDVDDATALETFEVVRGLRPGVFDVLAAPTRWLAEAS